MKKKNQKHKYLAIGALVLLISLGYAFLSANLKIDGVTNIGSSEWDVHFDNVIVRQFRLSGTATATDAQGVVPSIKDNDQLVEYEVTLKQPGDVYEFTVDVVNEGSIDAEIDAIVTKILLDGATEEVTLTDANMPEFLEYSVTWDDDTEIEKGTRLNSGDTKTIRVKVKYKADVTNDIYEDAQGQTIEFKLSIDYVQADVKTNTNTDAYVYTVNIYDNNNSSRLDGTNTSVVWNNQAIPSAWQYATPELAMAAFNNRPIYLRHKIENGVASESYVGFVVTNEMVAAAREEWIMNNCESDEDTACIADYHGMTTGTYYLKGDTILELSEGYWGCKSEYEDEEGNCIGTSYNTNKTTLTTAFGSSHCDNPDDDSPDFGCHASSLGTTVNLYGNVSIYYDGTSSCSVYHDGIAMCGVF